MTAFLAVRDSTSDPIQVGWLAGPGPGAVGLTLAPGKRDAATHRRAFLWHRDLEADLRRLRREERADVLVCLLEPFELQVLGIPDLATLAEQHGLAFRRLPIPDAGLPVKNEPVRRLVEDLRRRVARGERVVVHCAGGLGRSGLIGGCYLRAQGLGAEETLAELRRARGPRCPEMPWQIAYVRAWPDVAGVGLPRRFVRDSSGAAPGVRSSAACPATSTPKAVR